MIVRPDFFMSAAGEVIGDLALTRACWSRGPLRGGARGDHMLVDIQPTVIGQTYGLGGQDISTLVLSSRFDGYTLFPFRKWPCPVHISRILDCGVIGRMAFTAEEVEVIAWGLIFPSADEAVAQWKGGGWRAR